MDIYVVEKGDTVDSIAAGYGIVAERLIAVNQLEYPYRLAVGQALLILTEEEANVESDKREISVNGYAYPFIRNWILRQTLPYLTDLSVFSYGFTFEGELIYPLVSDDWMLSLSGEFGTRPILTLTPFGPDGNFNNQLIHSVVRNPEYSSRLIGNLLEVMREKGYVGVDIDFEFILAEDRDYFTDFVRNVTETMNDNGYTASVALAPKTSATQQGLLYEGKDYKALGEAANSVLLMTYEWGYTYGPPMAVAPLNMVRRVIEYAVTEIDNRKIDMGIPNYGYDWPLPYTRGQTKATTIGNIEAVQIAINNNAVIMFDETAQSPYFRYNVNGTEHEVWFEDVRSINAKFNLLEEFNLRGAGYWTIMQWFRPNWELLNYRFKIKGQ